VRPWVTCTMFAAPKGVEFNRHGRKAVGHVSKQIEARRADIFIGDFKFYAAPSALVVLGSLLIHGLTAVATP
jgi:hypothetical protein